MDTQVKIVGIFTAIVAIALISLNYMPKGYDEGYAQGISNADTQLSSSSAMCEIEFSGKASGLLKGLLNISHSLPANSTLKVTEADGDLELSGKVKFPCGRMEKFFVEQVLPLYLTR